MQDRGTRQPYWRVLWMVLSIGMIGISAYILAELYAKRLTSIQLIPESTSMSVRFLLDRHSRPVLREDFAAIAPFSQTPLYFSELYPFISREVSIHFSDSEILGIQIDQPLSTEFIQEIESLGLFYHTTKTGSLISRTESVVVAEKAPLRFRYRIKASNADLILHQSMPQRFTGKLTNKHLTFFGTSFGSYSSATIPVPESITTQALIPVDTEQVLNQFSQLLTIPEFNAELPTSTLYLGIDERGPVLYLFVPFMDFSKEQLATIGREIMNRTELSTSALTLQDGTRIQEIRSNPQKIRSTITSSDDITRISLIGASGDEVVIHGTEQGFSLANRDFFEQISSNPHLSTCHKNAQFYLNSVSTLPYGITSRIENVFTKFGVQELAITKNQTRFCFDGE